MKGIRPLLDAVRLWDSGYQVVLAGEVNAESEEQKEQWEVTHTLRATEAKHPDRLRWVGFQDDAGRRGLYSAAEVGVMPSTHEPFGIVALEFMAAGVPLISTEVGGLGEVVTDGRGGEYSLIVEPNNSGQIHEALTLLRADAGARERLSALGRKRAAEFDWHTAADATVAVYEEIIRRKRDAQAQEPR
jgi:glycogen(starch) synthase